jgi:3,4-dihydroxy 2-butanone 4-phosphate synthase/GTP cyclohydrolase II
VLVRVHSECLTGDVLGSTRCDCGAQLEDAMARVVAAGAGAIVYLRGHEGRGVGIAAKLAAYRLQDQGRDTVDANLDLGLPVDARHYAAAAQILRGLGVERIRLLTNNPDKVTQLRDLGLDVTESVPLPPRVTAPNLAYLRTKRDRLGHDLDRLGDPDQLDHPDDHDTEGRRDAQTPTTAGAI